MRTVSGASLSPKIGEKFSVRFSDVSITRDTLRRAYGSRSTFVFADDPPFLRRAYGSADDPPFAAATGGYCTTVCIDTNTTLFVFTERNFHFFKI